MRGSFDRGEFAGDDHATIIDQRLTGERIRRETPGLMDLNPFKGGRRCLSQIGITTSFAECLNELVGKGSVAVDESSEKPRL